MPTLKTESIQSASSRASSVHARAGWALVGVGMTVRAIEYLHNKAVWLDEAHLALNILRRGYAGLTQSLDYSQGAPLGFLWAERLAVDVLGPGEFSLRLLPLLASLAASILVYAFLRRYAHARGFLVALAVFTLAIPVIRYASEVKAYATDLSIALALYLLLFPIARRPLTFAYAALIACAGAASVWLAFPALFVLIGIGAVLFAHAVIAQDRRRAALLACVGAVWIASIALDYVVMLRHNTGDAELRTWWLDRFMPLPPRTFSDVNWFVRTYFEAFAEPLGLGVGGAGVGALLFGIGAFALWCRDRLRLALLLAPIGAALGASGAQVYPFMGRFLLFAVPLMLVGMAEGWAFLAENVQRRAILAIAGIALLIQPAAASLKGVLKPGEDGIRPAFAYLDSHWRDGDRLYVYCWAVPLFEYYEIAKGRDFSNTNGLPNRANWAGYRADLEPFRGAERVWVVLTNTPKQLVGQEDKYVLTYLDEMGIRSDGQAFAESSVYLYDLRERLVK